MVSEAVTQAIRVSVRSRYVDQKSNPQQGRFIYAYRIRITNECDETVQLLRRHWVIQDGVGREHEVKGDGVVGEQPTLEPGESFEYTSFCPLGTQFGVMRGSYQMMTSDGRPFDVEVAPFRLYIPALAN